MSTGNSILGLVIGIAFAFGTSAATPDGTTTLDDREKQIRDRYEEVLTRTPMQESAFDRVYTSYLEAEGVEAWITKLTPAEGEAAPGALVLLGRVYERQFKTEKAIETLEKAQAAGFQAAELDLLLGRLYYENGQDDRAATLLSAALEQSLDPQTRGDLVRILGNLYLRQGKRDEAIAAWKRMTEDNPTDTLAQTELAEIYEDNRMWEEAIGAYTRIVELSENDPYQKCRALRAAGRAHIQREAYGEAIAAFEAALNLVAPGNWLFEDLKLRLVGVYQDLGDLEGLVTYVTEKLEADPGDTEFRDLLAETYTRMARFEEAEVEHKKILERDPGRATTHEHLITLYERMERNEDVVATYESLIKQYPTEPDYLRRLGELQLRLGNTEAALASWRRVLDETPTANEQALLATWFETHEFTAEAITAYEAALALKPSKEWTFQLATLKHAQGEEEAAKALWVGVLSDESSAAERAEVATILETFDYLTDAEPLLSGAYAQEPENWEIAHAYAKNLMRQDRYDEAVPFFDTMAGQEENEYFRDRGEAGLLDAYEKLGILAEKKAEWEEAVRNNPEDAGLHMRLARLYGGAGDKDGALALVERCVELEPENSDYLHTLARAYNQGHMTEQSIETYRKLIAADANRAGGYYRELLDIYLRADFKDQSIETAQKIVELSPADAEAQLDLGQVYMTYQKQEEALQAYRTALRLEPNEPDYYRQYGQALMGEDRLGEAQDAFRKMLDVAQEDDTRIQAVNSLTGIYMREGKVERLLDEFQERVRNTPKKLAAYQELSAIHQQNGEITRSLGVLEEGYNAVDDKGDALKALVRSSYEAQDFDRVVRYFEELIDVSGKASAFEYERLGKVYAQLGQLDKARSTWQKIVDEDPDNPKAYITFAKALRDGGFYEEASAATEAALERDPHNYQLRFQYAQDLAGHEDMGTAYEQLQTLLDLGPSPEEEEKEREKEEREKKVKRIQRGQPTYQRANLFSPNYRPGQNYYYRNSLQGGKFETIRPQVISTMAGMAENSIGLDEFVETYKSRVDANPKSVDAVRDLIMVYESTNRMEEARAAAEAMAVLRPDDVEVLDTLAVQYSVEQEIDKSLEKLARIDALQPTRQKENDLARIYLLFRAEKKEDGRALLTRLVEENPEDSQILSIAVNAAAQFGEKETLVALHEQADKLDDKVRRNMLQSLAYGYSSVGDMETAATLFETMLFEEDPDTGNAYRIPRGNRISLYTPQHGSNNNQGMYYGGGMYRLRSQGVIQNLDYRRSNALEQLSKFYEGEKEAAFQARMEEEAGRYTTAESARDRERAWSFGLLLTAQHVVKTEYDEALAVLTPFIEAGVEDASAYNLANYIYEQKDDYEAILKNYDTLRALYPGQVRDVLRAETTALMLAERYDDAAEHIRELARRGMPPQEVVEIIVQLKEDEKSDLARTLLEEQLTGLQRNPMALSTLAAIHAEDNEYETAMDLAREAWERKAQGGTSSRYYSYGYYYSSGSSVDNDLQTWYNYARQAGKADEMVKEFEERLEKQPGSISAYEQLASIYTLSNDEDKAIALYQQLGELRPHYIKAKTALAQLYERTGKYKEAIAQYESFIKSRPSLYRSMSWQVRRLYQRMGKGDELAKIEEDIVSQARTPDQLQDLAWRFRNDGEFEKAKELYERVIKMQPNQSWYRTELATVLRELGQDEEALAVFAEWYASPLMRSQGYVDQNLLRQMASQYKALDRLDELKEINAAELADKPDDLVAKSVSAHVAMAEHRFEEATNQFLDIMKSRQDGNLPDTMIEMAEYRGNALEIVEQLAADDQFSNYWNVERLAKIYISAGNREKAMEYWRKFADQQGNWGFQNVMQGLRDFGLYAEAEDFYLKNRKKTRDMDNIAMDMYLQGHGFEELVQGMLQMEVKGLVEGLVGSLIRDDRTTYRKGLDILTPLIEREPENIFLLAEMGRLHQKFGAPAEALPFLEQAIAVNPNDDRVRRDMANIFAELHRQDDAVAMYSAWVTEKPISERASMAVQFCLEHQRQNQAQTIRDLVAESIDANDLEKLDRDIARYVAKQGHARAYADQLKTRFEEKQDNETFDDYLNHLLASGFNEEAYGFCVSQVDSGLLSSRNLNSDDVFKAAVQYGSLEDVIALMWNYIRHGERWERENQISNVVRHYRDLGYGRQAVDALYEKALAEDPPFYGVVMPLVDQYLGIGDKLSALAAVNALIEVTPHQRNLLEKKADILFALKQYDEALAQLDTMGGATSLRMESEESIKRISGLLQAERLAEAQTSLEALVAWDKSDRTAGRIGSAYLEAKQFALARPYLEQGLTYADERGQMAVSLVRCCLELGDVEAARTVWRENINLRDMTYLYREMNKPVYLPIAPEVLGARLTENPADQGALSMLGQVMLASGNLAGAMDQLKATIQVLPVAQHAEALARMGGLLVKEGQWKETLATSSTDDPIVVRAIALGATELPKDALDATQREQLLALPLEEGEDLVKLGNYFAEAKDVEAAVSFFNRVRALPSGDTTQQVQALEGLAELGALEDGVDILRELLAGQPDALVDNSKLLLFAAKTGEEALLEEMLAQRALRKPADDNSALYQELSAYYRAGASDPVEVLTFAETATLSIESWGVLASFFEELGNTAGEMVVQQRMVTGGYGIEEYDKAMARICTLASGSGDRAAALSAFLGLSPAYNDTDSLIRTMATEWGDADLTLLDGTLRGACENRSGNLMVANWIGQAAELAEYTGTPIDLAAWVEDVPLDDRQRADALQWTGLIETWRISPAQVIDDPRAFMEETRIKSMLDESGAPKGIEAWLSLEPRETLGTINLGTLLLADDTLGHSKGACAYTQLEATAEGRIDISFATNQESTEVWINGERIHKASAQRRVYPGQERFQATLKAGINHLVVISIGDKEGWQFALGTLPSDGGPTVQVVGIASAQYAE